MRVDPKTGWRWYDHPSTSSSSSSWQTASWWKSSSWTERFFLRTRGVFAYRQWRFLCKRREAYTGHQTRTQCHVPAHVIFSRAFFQGLPCHRLSHALHVHVAKGFTAQLTMECCVHKTFVFTLSAAWRTVHLL